jgi:hyperosmotically inducible protein
MRIFGKSMRFVLPVMVALAAGSAVGACSVTSGRESGEEYADNAAITAKVKTALANDGGLSLFNKVSVETYEEVVQLSGFVASYDDKARAGQIAQDVEGVRSVQNDLVVQP